MAHGECIHGSEFLTDINGPDSPESCAMCLCDQRDAMTARIAYLEEWQTWAREAAAMCREWATVHQLRRMAGRAPDARGADVKLYRVTQTITAMVAADDEDEALRLGTAVLQHDYDGGITRDRATCTAVARLSDIPREWRDAIAYGDNPLDLTCEQILSGEP